MSLANYITIGRILLVPVFVLMFYLPLTWGHLACAIIFTFACLTDWLDGYLARSLGQVSALGAFLDPVADKLIIVVALVLIVGEKGMPYLAIPAAVIVSREIVVSALREWMSEIGKRTSIAVSFLGKIKTFVQMLALILLLLYRPEHNAIIGDLGYALIYIAATLTLISMMFYLKAAWPDLVLDVK